MERQKELIKCRLRKLNEEKKLNNVFDKARNNVLYKSHRKRLTSAEKKIDNFPPIYDASKFFPQKKMQISRIEMKWRLHENLGLVNIINKIHRTKGKVDCYNPKAARRSSKVPLKIFEQKDVERQNKIISENLKKVRPTRISCLNHLLDDWEMTSRRIIIESIKYPIAINGLLTSDFDVFLEDPPSQCEFKMSPKLFLKFYLVNHGDIGKIIIMLDCNVDQDILKKFIDLCNMKNDSVNYQGSKVHKIIQGLVIEAGLLQHNLTYYNACKILPRSCDTGDHLYAGTLSMVLEDDCSVSSKFSITLKKMSILNEKEIVIGRVVKGLDILSAVESYGTRFGLPKKTILIKSCGLIK